MIYVIAAIVGGVAGSALTLFVQGEIDRRRSLAMLRYNGGLYGASDDELAAIINGRRHSLPPCEPD